MSDVSLIVQDLNNSKTCTARIVEETRNAWNYYGAK